MRIENIFSVKDKPSFRNQLLNYSSRSEYFVFLDSCENGVYGETEFDYLFAGGNYKSLVATAGNAFGELQQFIDKNKEWFFGYLGYDLKNETEKLSSQNNDRVAFPDMLFFIPEIIVRVKNGEVKVSILLESSITSSCNEIFGNICEVKSNIDFEPNGINLIPRIEKKDYLEKINKIRKNIIDGDVYELTFCQEFYCENVSIEPLCVFQELCEISKAPFSVLFRWENKYLISASPERFLKKNGDAIISQPIKGTSKRSADPVVDTQLKTELFHNEKDRAENVMIVDLVRNDLARIGKTGTIKVDELFGIYTFEQVHQMVSTISTKVKEDILITDILKNTFPIGSMTGAPKVMAMELIEHYEESKRGLFSGAFGYISPEGDFDFNVVIRSIIYDALQQYISVQVGGAIVFDSVAEKEYEECVVKLSGIVDVLGRYNGGKGNLP